MTIAIGVAPDGTFAHFVREARSAGILRESICLRDLVDGDFSIETHPGGQAWLSLGSREIRLDPNAGYFCRLIDLGTYEPEPKRAARWRTAILALSAWLAGIPGRVVNRPNRDNHNGSKPLHEHVLRKLGFRVPDSITTSDVTAVQDFVGEEAVISKTVSGVRAHAALVTAADFEGFRPGSGPVHLQRYVKGDDVRAHVVGGRIVAQRVSGATADYRHEACFKDLVPCEVPEGLGDLLVVGTRSLGLAIGGWDFKVAADGTWWCLEVNPMPGYSPYDERCEGRISRAIFDYLSSG
jgi:hypothetical protein